MSQIKNDPIVSVNSVRRAFPVSSGLWGRKSQSVKALDDVSLQLQRGETLGLVGESGCGKSTLARLIVGLDKPSGGEISFNEQVIANDQGVQIDRMREHIQLVFQDPYASLNPRMTARQSIAEPLLNFTAVRGGELDAQTDQLAQQVGLNDYLLDRFPHELSGGQCQRVGLARAIALNPDVLVADEPISALDVSIQAQILNLLLDIKKTRDLSLVFVSHDLSVVSHIADRVAVMYLGRIVELGTAAEVFQSPRHPYTQMLLSSVPHPVPNQNSAHDDIRGELPSPISPPSGCHFRTRCTLADEHDCTTKRPELRGDAHLTACHKFEELRP